MSTSIGQDEPHRSPKMAYFSCAIGVYFMSFFYEHPVSVKTELWPTLLPGTECVLECLFGDNKDIEGATAVCRQGWWEVKKANHF